MIDVEIEELAWIEALPQAEVLARRAGLAALAVRPRAAAEAVTVTPPPSRRRRADPPPPLPGGGAVGSCAAAQATGDYEAVEGAQRPEFPNLVILLTDDATVQDLNARFRGKDAATNVLAFPAADNPERHLGDVALGFGVCAREAAEQGKPLAHHLQHLVAHGVLHLLGYDHMSDDEAETMEGLERVVLAGLGAPDPYSAGEKRP